MSTWIKARMEEIEEEKKMERWSHGFEKFSTNQRR